MTIKNYTILRNASACRKDSIPVLKIEEFRNWVIETSKSEGRIVSLFAEKSGGGFKLYGILGIDSKGELRIASTELLSNSYPSIAKDLTQAQLFEREIFENFGIIPEGHPWLKPVRKMEGYQFYSAEGDEIHEVAVGPVHAGVIEPGHFRFQCHGENVFNLEIKLGYQHRGVEKLMLDSAPAKRMILAESIAGDSVISHGLAYCHAVEALANNKEVTQRARIIRAVALELERIANHVGDLGAIANDVGFQPAASYLGALRASFLNMLMDISGNRFGRSLLCPGGVKFDISHEMAENLKEKLLKNIKFVEDIVSLIFSNPSVTSRFENTGIVKYETAKELGLVGVAARACNLQRDIRADYPAGFYRFKKVIIAKAATGDVFARARVRSLEIRRSSEIITEILSRIPSERIFLPVDSYEKSFFAVSMVEGWRGETVHIAITDENGKVCCYTIVDPSFHNWNGLEMAMRNGQISDFPLCNKSFNLSYAGYDL